MGTYNRPTSKGGDCMKGKFTKSLKQLKQDIEREVEENGTDNNDCGNADNSNILPVENKLHNDKND